MTHKSGNTEGLEPADFRPIWAMSLEPVDFRPMWTMTWPIWARTFALLDMQDKESGGLSRPGRSTEGSDDGSGIPTVLPHLVRPLEYRVQQPNIPFEGLPHFDKHGTGKVDRSAGQDTARALWFE